VSPEISYLEISGTNPAKFYKFSRALRSISDVLIKEACMKKAIFLLLIVFFIYGCEVPQDASVKSTGEEEELLVEESVVIEEELPIALQKDEEEVVSEEVKVEALVLAKEANKIILGSDEEIIKQNRWGFSIYDPKTGVVEYYASRGGYLGKRSIN
ncbi:hypothetical protein ACFL2Y_05240, partial [Candidatus Omnitrophota bacterium]